MKIEYDRRADAMYIRLRAGTVVGDHPWVKENFSWVALAMIIVPALPAIPR